MECLFLLTCKRVALYFLLLFRSLCLIVFVCFAAKRCGNIWKKNFSWVFKRCEDLPKPPEAQCAEIFVAQALRAGSICAETLQAYIYKLTLNTYSNSVLTKETVSHRYKKALLPKKCGNEDVKRQNGSFSVAKSTSGHGAKVQRQSGSDWFWGNYRPHLILSRTKMVSCYPFHQHVDQVNALFASRNASQFVS